MSKGLLQTAAVIFAFYGMFHLTFDMVSQMPNGISVAGARLQCTESGCILSCEGESKKARGFDI